MWCSPATVLLILAVVIVSGVRTSQGSSCCYTTSTFSPVSPCDTSTSERVAPRTSRRVHLLVVATVLAFVYLLVPVTAGYVVAVVTTPSYSPIHDLPLPPGLPLDW